MLAAENAVLSPPIPHTRKKSVSAATTAAAWWERQTERGWGKKRAGEFEGKFVLDTGVCRNYINAAGENFCHLLSRVLTYR